jgi:soluble lytic murein transglycosylase-like protein
VRYGVNLSLMEAIIRCESSFNPNAVGDFGQSFGLVQIFLPAHPSITKDQALDPTFAVDFLARNLAAGKGSMWTCFRLLQ